MTGPQPTEDNLLLDLIKTNNETEGKTITKEEYKEHGDYNPWQAANRFGSWKEAKTSAGVYHPEPDRKRISNQELLEDLGRVNEKVDGQVTIPEYREQGKYSVSLFYNRFDSWETARQKSYHL